MLEHLDQRFFTLALDNALILLLMLVLVQDHERRKELSVLGQL